MTRAASESLPAWGSSPTEAKCGGEGSSSARSKCFLLLTSSDLRERAQSCCKFTHSPFSGLLTAPPGVSRATCLHRARGFLAPPAHTALGGFSRHLLTPRSGVSRAACSQRAQGFVHPPSLSIKTYVVLYMSYFGAPKKRRAPAVQTSPERLPERTRPGRPSKLLLLPLLLHTFEPICSSQQTRRERLHQSTSYTALHTLPSGVSGTV